MLRNKQKNTNQREKLNNKNNNMDGAALIMIFIKLNQAFPRTTQNFFTPHETSNMQMNDQIHS